MDQKISRLLQNEQEEINYARSRVLEILEQPKLLKIKDFHFSRVHAFVIGLGALITNISADDFFVGMLSNSIDKLKPMSEECVKANKKMEKDF